MIYIAFQGEKVNGLLSGAFCLCPFGSGDKTIQK